MDCREYDELSAADIDGVLTAAERDGVDRHLRTCERCAATRRAQAAVRTVVRERAPRYEAGDALRVRLAAALDDEHVQVPSLGERRRRISRQLVFIGALAALMLLVLVPLRRSSTPELLAVLAENVRAVEAQEVPLAERTNSVEDLRAYYRASGRIGFANSVEDFSGIGLHPVGGMVARIGEVDTTFTLYEGGPARVVCRRFPVGSVRLPKHGRRVAGADLFTIDGVTVHIKRIGKVICCLAAKMAPDDFIRLLNGGGPSRAGEPHPAMGEVRS